MKKYLRILSALCLVCLLIPTLCGCAMVDELRESRATYDGDGNILWNGTVYKKLPINEDFCPETNHSEVYVADEDVPVLLLSTYGDQMLTADKEKLFLEHNSYMDERYELAPVYYCREDRYDEFFKKIRYGFPIETVCYHYGYYDEEKMEYIEKEYHLTDEQRSTIEKIMTTVKPTQSGEGWYLDYEWMVSLYDCTEDMLFQRYAMDVCVSGKTYYLRVDDERHTYFYQVPEEYETVFGQIMDAYMAANELENWQATM